MNQTKNWFIPFSTEKNDLGRSFDGPSDTSFCFCWSPKMWSEKIIHGDGHTFSWECMNTPVTPGIPRLRVRINPNHFKYNYLLCHDFAPKRLV